MGRQMKMRQKWESGWENLLLVIKCTKQTYVVLTHSQKLLPCYVSVSFDRDDIPIFATDLQGQDEVFANHLLLLLLGDSVVSYLTRPWPPSTSTWHDAMAGLFSDSIILLMNEHVSIMWSPIFLSSIFLYQVSHAGRKRMGTKKERQPGLSQEVQMPVSTVTLKYGFLENSCLLLIYLSPSASTIFIQILCNNSHTNYNLSIYWSFRWNRGNPYRKKL